MSKASQIISSLGSLSHAISQLEISKNIVDTNFPINLEEGNIDQANLEKETSTSFSKAISILKELNTLTGDK